MCRRCVFLASRCSSTYRRSIVKKLDAKAWKGVFVGYAPAGYRIWNPKTRSIVTARDVDFLEMQTPVGSLPTDTIILRQSVPTDTIILMLLFWSESK